MNHFINPRFRVGAKRTAPIAGSLKCRPTRSADWCSQGASSLAPCYITPSTRPLGLPLSRRTLLSAAPPSAVSNFPFTQPFLPCVLFDFQPQRFPHSLHLLILVIGFHSFFVRHPTFIHNTKLHLNLASTPYSIQHHYLTLPYCIQPAQETTSLDLPYFHTSILGQQNENCLHRHPRIHPAFHRGCAP